ncbi:tetratricopeptide repeat protein [Moritella viscosa]|uniref:MSHA biogenesis protein MshN n=1 Tax=Moritella viscosa TaxID=80854 RepID=A0A090KE34_9GAMM|nr:tetratricopeptide repeat protein [Moritella viscosa]CED62123.1 type IV pilus, mannose-sensitive hemagglutinin D (MSHN) [Moritella viscosa]SGY92358.1 MSHA biogenesis protein MshN [Moritella viscosa]SGZ02611.1 MSHA biogenesis protein MshN [Moritella viscosa]SGZ03091.1 MSHA biogenesis protein MshN [Moritella viscosa]SHO07307.1 MSHA biogenesis protein MshN [Moritella viscosa]
MSVINQMLQGLDKGAQQQQRQAEQSGVVIVAASARNNNVIICLFVAIVMMGLLAAYLFVQKQNTTVLVAPVVNAAVLPGRTEKARIKPEQVQTVARVNTNHHDVNEKVIANHLLEKPVVVSPVVKKVMVSTAQPIALPVTPITKVIHIEPKAATPAKLKPTTEIQSVAISVNNDAEKENIISIKAITRTPVQQAQLYAKKAEAALLYGDKVRAKHLFSKVLTLDKQHDLSREKLAAILYGEQRTESAVTLLQEGLSVSPAYTNFRLMLARIYLKNKNKQQAYYYLKPHKPEIDGNVDYYAMLAGLAQSLDDLDTALIAYKQLTNYEPNRAKWWLGLGISADKAQQVRLALTAYHTAQNMGQLSASSRNYINARIAQLEKP